MPAAAKSSPAAGSAHEYGMKNKRTISGIAAMRIHVSVFGTFQSIRSRSGSLGTRVQVIIKTSGQGCADSGHLLEVGDSGPHDPLQPPEVLEQLATLGRPEPRHDLQDGFVVAPRALAPMAGDG